MPKIVRSQLTVRDCDGLGPGRHHDGEGLFLNVTENGLGRSWVLRLSVGGRRRHLGLGPYPAIPLKAARDKALELRRMALSGIDPRAEKARARACPGFAEAARTVHATQILPTSKNAKAAAQWLSTLEAHAFPRFGELALDRVSSADVVAALTPIWHATPETARRVRQRIRTVMEWGRGQGHVTGDCVVRLADHALGRQAGRKAGQQKHHAALPWVEMPGVLAGLLAHAGKGELARLALIFLTLTAARSGEVRGARREEIDLEAGLWTVPAERMKAGVAHVVPLSPQAVAVLERARAVTRGRGALVFPGNKGQPMSDMTLLQIFRRAGLEATPHGMRSAFRDWAAEATAHPREIAEMALAHTVGNAVERACRRSDLLARRRALMEDWGRFCDSKVCTNA